MKHRLITLLMMGPLLGLAALQRISTWLLPWPVVALSARLAQGKLFMTQDEALAKAFPQGSRIERKTLFLNPSQVKAIEDASKTRLESTLVTYYVGLDAQGNRMGTAFFDTRVVRTMPMTTMTLVRPDGTIGFIEVLSFYEPEDYLPRPRWLELFTGKPLSDRLRTRRDIPNVTGATITCQAMTDGARQTLALHSLTMGSDPYVEKGPDPDFAGRRPQ